MTRSLHPVAAGAVVAAATATVVAVPLITGELTGSEHTAAGGFDLQGSCLMPDELVADPGSGDAGWSGSLGSADDELGTPLRRPDAVREDSYGVGEVADEGLVHAAGRVGADVEAIVVTTPGGTEVEACVDDGPWAAWRPGGEPRGDNPELFGPPPPQKNEVTLRDGTVRDTLRP